MVFREENELCTDIRDMLQTIYGLAISNDPRNKDAVDILPQLVLENMDEEQIWQQMELRNGVVLPQLMQQTAQMLNIDEQYLAIRLHEEEEEDEEEGEEEEEVDDEEERMSTKYITNNPAKASSSNQEGRRIKSQRRSEVEDDFFNLDEMEEFLKAEEAKEERRQKSKSVTFADMEEAEIDYFDENLGKGADDGDESEDEGNNVTYKDYFATDSEGEEEESLRENAKGRHEDFDDAEPSEQSEEESELEDDEHNEKDKEEEDEEEEEENEKTTFDDKPKSSFEIRQARLEQRMRDYEDEVLGEKPWQLKGEIVAANRPQNSLLEEVLEYDSTVQPATIITEKTTKCLEDIIKQRIRDKAWDDVERVVRPIKTPQEYRKQLVLDHEKSKLSLAQIYEKEYQNEMAKFDSKANNAEPEEPKEHQEIRGLMHNLFLKLDALSNFHFVPKPVAPEIKIVTNTSAVTMEEVAPVAISDAKLLAPEEVFRGPRHEMIGKSEETKTDKNRARRKKKNKQRAIHKALEAKDEHRQKLGIPLTKKEESAKLTKKLIKHRNVQKVRKFIYSFSLFFWVPLIDFHNFFNYFLCRWWKIVIRNPH